MLDTLLLNACILTQNPARQVLKDGLLGIQNGRIALVRPRDDSPLPPAREVLDCRGGLVLPGLIDGHGHAGHPMTKLISTNTLGLWGRCAERVYFFHSTPEFWYRDAQLSAMERIRFGVTTGMNVIANEPRADSPEFVQEHARGYAEVGAATVIAVGPGSQRWPKPLSRWDGERLYHSEATWEECMQNTEDLLHGLHMGRGGMQRVFVTPFTIVPSIPTWGRCAPEQATGLTEFDRRQLRAVKALARKYKTGIHTDAFGNGISLMAQCEDALLGENVLLQHCYDLTPEEVRLVAATKTNIGHSPEQSHHFCPFTELIHAGANAVITSDGNGPRVSFDMFEHMRRAQDLENLRFGEYYTLTAGDLLDRVTLHAARALGLEAEIGSLETGKRADVILLDAVAPHLTTGRDPLQTCVYAASGLDVRTVFAGGAKVLENGRFPNLDEAAIVQRADEVAKAAIADAGLTAYTAQPPAFGTVYETFHTPTDLPADPPPGL